MSNSNNELIKKRDKENKKNLNLKFNGENKYKDKYIQKTVLKKRESNNKLQGNKKVIKEKENISQRNAKKNCDTIHYRYVPKKSKSNPRFSNINNSNNLSNPLGPYSNMLNGTGGFCTKISYLNSRRELYKMNKNNNNNNQLYNDYLNKFVNIKKNGIKNKKGINFSNIQNNIISKNIGNKNKSKNKNNYTKFVNKKKSSNRCSSNKNDKLCINEVNNNNNIKYLKLITKIQNNLIKGKDNMNIQKHKKTNSFNEEYNKICKNEHFSLNKIPKKINLKKNNNLLLIRQANEQFSVNNNFRIKTFNDLCQIESVLLNYPSTIISNNNNINSKSFITNNSICSNQAELSIINISQLKTNLNGNENSKTMTITVKDNNTLGDSIQTENNHYIKKEIISNVLNNINNITESNIEEDNSSIINSNNLTSNILTSNNMTINMDRKEKMK